MQRYLMNFDTRRLPRYEADALVIGSGVAGLTAACTALAVVGGIAYAVIKSAIFVILNAL